VQGLTVVIASELPGDVLWLSLGGGIGLPAIVLGVLALASRRMRAGEVRGRFKAMAAIAGGLVGVILACGSVVAGQPELAVDVQIMSGDRLARIGRATSAYAKDHDNSLPPAEAFRAKDGRPGLSWRVAMLPYLGQADLYKQFNLDEPWDSPNNLRLLDKMPHAYALPHQKRRGGLTHFQVFVGPKTPFERNVRVRLTQQGDGFPDGTANTILVVLAKDPVPWTKPDDLDYDPEKPLPALIDSTPTSIGRVRLNDVLRADGYVRPLPKSTPEATLRALITRNGGEAVTWP
jgi:hypothetical protein